MGLFDSLFQSSEIHGIARDTLRFIREACRETHPNEYMGLLRATDAQTLGLHRSGRIITDVLVIPGTTSSSVKATMKSNMVPNDHTAVGSVHSHPNGVLQPSDEDLRSFTRGDVHIIVGAPYDRDSWQAFNTDGSRRSLRVIDIDLPDPATELGFDPESLADEFGEDKR